MFWCQMLVKLRLNRGLVKQEIINKEAIFTSKLDLEILESRNEY